MNSLEFEHLMKFLEKEYDLRKSKVKMFLEHLDLEKNYLDIKSTGEFS